MRNKKASMQKKYDVSKQKCNRNWNKRTKYDQNNQICKTPNQNISDKTSSTLNNNSTFHPYNNSKQIINHNSQQIKDTNNILNPVPRTNRTNFTNLSRKAHRANKITFNNKNKKNQQLECLFHQTVAKIFKAMDLFGRGSISEANISNYIPSYGLYFLGSVFHAIRGNRQQMTQQQFFSQCMKVYNKSSSTDIKQFVENMEKFNANANQKQDDGTPRPPIKLKVEQKLCIEPVQQKKQILQPLKNLHDFQNVAAKTKNKNKRPFSPLYFPQNQSEVNKAVKSPECSSPFFQQQNKNHLQRIGSKQKGPEIDRIDKLSLRLQDYIRSNHERLERSKNARCIL